MGPSLIYPKVVTRKPLPSFRSCSILFSRPIQAAKFFETIPPAFPVGLVQIHSHSRVQEFPPAENFQPKAKPFGIVRHRGWYLPAQRRRIAAHGPQRTPVVGKSQPQDFAEIPARGA